MSAGGMSANRNKWEEEEEVEEEEESTTNLLICQNSRIVVNYSYNTAVLLWLPVQRVQKRQTNPSTPPTPKAWSCSLGHRFYMFAIIYFFKKMINSLAKQMLSLVLFPTRRWRCRQRAADSAEQSCTTILFWEISHPIDSCLYSPFSSSTESFN